MASTHGVPVSVERRSFESANAASRVYPCHEDEQCDRASRCELKGDCVKFMLRISQAPHNPDRIFPTKETPVELTVIEGGDNVMGEAVA